MRLAFAMRTFRLAEASLHEVIRRDFPEGAEALVLLRRGQLILTRATVVRAGVFGGCPEVVVRLSKPNRRGRQTVRRLPPSAVQLMNAG